VVSPPCTRHRAQKLRRVGDSLFAGPCGMDRVRQVRPDHAKIYKLVIGDHSVGSNCV